MGRWDSTSPTRARSRSPRDNSGREGGSNTRDDRRDRDRDRRRKGSRWEDEDRDKDRDRNYRDREDKGRRVVGQGREKDGDKDRERRRRDDGGSSRRDRDRERDRDRDRERDRDRGGRDKERNRSRDRTRDRKDRHRDDDGDGKRKQQSKKPSSQEPEEEAPPKEAPNFNRTTHLVSETNTFNGVVLKYVEPSESRLPPSSITYRLYVFKSSEILETITLSTRTAWLFGRDRLVADVPIDHPSASKQHAVIQFRFVTKVNEYGEREGGVKPYVIDLGSANGTTVNGETVPEKRYFELKEKDIIGFGHSSREYVLMIEK